MRASLTAEPADAESTPSWLWMVFVFSALIRLLFRSQPYYVDGPRHVSAILSGEMVIQAPGYYLYTKLGSVASHLFHCSPATALSSVNIAFGALGVLIFGRLVIRMFPERLAMLLTVFYACSVTCWFDADIHSSYASTLFFAPALLYVVLVRKQWWWVGLLWALMSGFRPSDGMFVAPFLIYAMFKAGWRSAVAILTAVPVLLIWYMPSVSHMGGHILAPLTSAHDQASSLANGLLIPGVSWQRKFGNCVHILFGAWNAWNILTVFLLVKLFNRDTWRSGLALWFVPGALFYLLYFFSDSLYLSYMVAPGLILVGEQVRYKRLMTPALLLASTLACGQMLFARPLPTGSLVRAILNSYCLQYSGWALQHGYSVRLAGAVHGL